MAGVALTPALPAVQSARSMTAPSPDAPALPPLADQVRVEKCGGRARARGVHGANAHPISYTPPACRHRAGHLGRRVSIVGGVEGARREIRRPRRRHPCSFLSPRALLSLTPSDPSTTRTVHPILLPAAPGASSAFAAHETGGAPAAVINFTLPGAPPTLSLIVIAAPLVGPTAAAAVAALAASLPPPRAGAPPPLVVAAQALPAGLAKAALSGVVWGGVCDSPTWPAGGAVADAVAAAWLHCLAAVGRPAALVTAHGHRPAAGDQEDASAEAAVALAKAVAEKCGVAASPDRAARLRPSLAALRDGGRGESLSGAELMYS